MSLSAQIPKYDPQSVEADLTDLTHEVEDEKKVHESLQKDVVEQTALVRSFIADNSERISVQHKLMHERVKDLRELIKVNVELEEQNAEYRAVVSSEEALLLAKQLAELRAMSEQYKDLLRETGRAGRPPLF